MWNPGVLRSQEGGQGARVRMSPFPVLDAYTLREMTIRVGGGEPETPSTHLCRVRKHFCHHHRALWEEGGHEKGVTRVGPYKLSWTTTLPWS